MFTFTEEDAQRGCRHSLEGRAGPAEVWLHNLEGVEELSAASSNVKDSYSCQSVCNDMEIGDMINPMGSILPSLVHLIFFTMTKMPHVLIRHDHIHYAPMCVCVCVCPLNYTG